jgi:hypothetical protein
MDPLQLSRPATSQQHLVGNPVRKGLCPAEHTRLPPPQLRERTLGAIAALFHTREDAVVAPR